MTNTMKAMLGLLAIVAAFIAVKLWRDNTITAPVGVYSLAKVAPEMKSIPIIAIHPKTVQVYAPIAVAKLKLPDSMKNQVVVAANEVKATPRPQAIVTTLNPDTGEVTTIVRQDPYKWLQATQTGEVRLAYGYRGTEHIARLSVTEDLLQVKGINLGGTASLDHDGQHFVGVSMSYRW